MKNQTIYFNQSGEIHFNGKNWKNVVAMIPSEAKLLLVSGIKNNDEVPISIVKTREFRKSVKSMFLSKILFQVKYYFILFYSFLFFLIHFYFIHFFQKKYMDEFI